MLFNTIDFIIFFIVVFTLIVIIKNRKFQHLYLLFASFFFFYYSNNYLIILLIISIILDFYVGKEIWKTKKIINKKILLTLSIIGNLGLLGFYKYADFSISQFNDLGNSLGLAMDIPLLNLILPVGISFYTFQTLSYTIDIYRGRLEPSKSLGEFALFVAFFPQLVAGPILRASQFLPQLREKIENLKTNVKLRQVVIHSSNLKLGLTIMAFGFFKKMFFADNIRLFVDQIFQNPIGLDSFSVILGAIAFGVQIYCDFSGYSDIAIGLAMILGFKIPINFNKPYFATSPSDFWRKWHISLSTWLRDYLYIPLGGNKKSYGRIYLNVLIVMFLGGLWHGAAWNFVIWGMLHGTYLAIHKILTNKFPNLQHNEFFKSKAGKIFSIVITQYFIFLAWIPFRVHDFDQMMYSIEKFVIFDMQFIGINEFLLEHKFPIFLMLAFIGLHYFSYKKPKLIEIISNLNLKYWTVIITLFLILIVFFFNGNPIDFIYFKF